MFITHFLYKNDLFFLLSVLVRPVGTSHACNFQGMWKWKSVRPTTSRKAGYAPAWGCNGLKNLSLKVLRDVKEGGISARRRQPKYGDCARGKSTLYIRLFGRVTFDRRNGPSPFFFFFFFFTKNEGKNWFADWLIELACYRKNIRIFVSFFSHFFLPTSPTLLISPLVICYVLFHDARFPGWFIFLGSNARPLCKLLQVQQKIKGLFTWRRGTLGRWGNRLRSGNPLVHITSHFNLITFTW